jgi:hypothetical protein
MTISPLVKITQFEPFNFGWDINEPLSQKFKSSGEIEFLGLVGKIYR